jgi:hypothetical protein
MVEAPGLPVLYLVAGEAAILEDFCRSLKLELVKPLPRKVDVLAYLYECKIFHYTSLRYSNLLEPSQSFLVLED